MKPLHQNPDALSRFRRDVEVDGVAGAVARATAAGLWVRREDVATPMLDTMARMDAAGRDAFATRYASELADERAALAAIASQDGMHPVVAAAVATEVARERAAFIESRAAELERKWWIERRAEWRAQAETEAAAKFDAVQTHEPKPPAPTKRRAA